MDDSGEQYLHTPHTPPEHPLNHPYTRGQPATPYTPTSAQPLNTPYTPPAHPLNTPSASAVGEGFSEDADKHGFVVVAPVVGRCRLTLSNPC